MSECMSHFAKSPAYILFLCLFNSDVYSMTTVHFSPTLSLPSFWLDNKRKQ